MNSSDDMDTNQPHRTWRLIHDEPGYRLEAIFTHHPMSGITLELYAIWPKANHPEPHRLLSLTLPDPSLDRLGEAIKSETGLAHMLRLTRIAGPDDLIYQSGLVMTSMRQTPPPEIDCFRQKEAVERMRRDPKYKQD